MRNDRMGSAGPARARDRDRERERSSRPASDGATRESHKQRVDRELIELLNGLRVALPGVQMLFGFLLVVPFSQRFDQLSALDRGVYFTSLLSAAGSSAMFIAPSAYHRLRFRRGDKERILQTANRLAMWGFALLAVAMSWAMFVIANVLFGAPGSGLVAAGMGAVFLWFWFGLPLVRTLQEERSGFRPEPDG